MAYTYKLPKEEALRKALLSKLGNFPSDANDWACGLLSNATLELEETGRVDKEDKERKEVAIILRMPQKEYDSWSMDEIFEGEEAITTCANDLLQRNSGFKVAYTDSYPSLDDNPSDAKDIVLGSLKTEKLNVLGKDLIEKGKRMSNAYIIIFCLENLIRSFIDRILTEKVGEDYETRNTISNKILKKALTRKKEEDERHWIPIRGDKILYYLDFVELGDVILFNKDYFEGLIPTEDWIRGKFEELKEIRNRVAHNTYIDDDTFKALEVYYGQLVRQIGK